MRYANSEFVGQEAEISVISDGNPFVEYSISPNTILEQGAFGVFAIYQVTEKEVILEESEN